jgi:anthranilate synthase/aminodeoxychorismate synthase-like glutamine amidotransferase
MRVLLLDNYDSFTFNLVQALRARGAEVLVVRSDTITVDEAFALDPDRIVLSPGPGRPEASGVLMPLARAALRARVPTLGVCLGHQALALAMGASVVRAPAPRHGKVSRVRHDGTGLFRGLPDEIEVGRYHSLAVDASTLPAELAPIAWADDGVLMGVRHVDAPIHGVQYHPESFLTPLGERQLEVFLRDPG